MKEGQFISSLEKAPKTSRAQDVCPDPSWETALKSTPESSPKPDAGNHEQILVGF